MARNLDLPGEGGEERDWSGVPIKGTNADIYEYLENGGSVTNDIRGMSIQEMEDYFGDLDPAEFL